MQAVQSRPLLPDQGSCVSSGSIPSSLPPDCSDAKDGFHFLCMSAGDQLASIDLYDLSGDIGTVLAGEVPGHARDFLGPGDPPERNAADYLLGCRIAPAFECCAHLISVG